VKTLAIRPAGKLEVSGKSLAVRSGKGGLAERQPKTIDLVPAGKGGKGKGGSAGQARPGQSESESGEAEAPKGVVLSSQVVSMLVSLGMSEADAADSVRSAQLSQDNPRVASGGQFVNRRDGGAGYGGKKGRRGKKRGSEVEVKSVRQNAKAGLPNKPALPSPGGGGKPLALPGGGGKPLALPSGKMGISGSELAIPEKSAKDIFQKAATPKKTGLLDAAKAKLKEKAGETVKQAEENTMQGQIEKQFRDLAAQNFGEVKKLWKSGRYDEAIAKAAESPINPVGAGVKATRTAVDAVNWIRHQLSR